ncbi:hypothetical protein OROMI_032282 [Orobanche minor]
MKSLNFCRFSINRLLWVGDGNHTADERALLTAKAQSCIKAEADQCMRCSETV